MKKRVKKKSSLSADMKIIMFIKHCWC